MISAAYGLLQRGCPCTSHLYVDTPFCLLGTAVLSAFLYTSKKLYTLPKHFHDMDFFFAAILNNKKDKK